MRNVAWQLIYLISFADRMGATAPGYTVPGGQYIQVPNNSPPDFEKTTGFGYRPPSFCIPLPKNADLYNNNRLQRTVIMGSWTSD
jgi:hypothetical protein